MRNLLKVQVAIYALIEPSNYEVRYVGQTIDLCRRHDAHFYFEHKPRTRKERWIAKLRKEGLKPEFLILEYCDEAMRNIRERRWIDHFKTLNGDRLTNASKGGNGTLGLKMSAVARRNIGIASAKAWAEGKKEGSRQAFIKMVRENHPHKGKKFSKKVRAKISAASKARNAIGPAMEAVARIRASGVRCGGNTKGWMLRKKAQEASL